MASHSAISIDDDLATGKPRVALRAADDEAAGRIDVEFYRLVAELFGNHWLDDF